MIQSARNATNHPSDKGQTSQHIVDVRNTNEEGINISSVDLLYNSMCRPRSLCQIKSKILCMYDTLIQKVQKYQIKKITKSTNIYIDFILEELDFKINKTDIEFFQLNCFMFIFFLRSVSKEQVVNLVKISFHEFIVMFQNIFPTWDSI